MSTNEIAAKVKQMKEFERMIEEAQAEVEAIKDFLKEEMGDREEMIAGEYKITWKTVSSSRFDSKGLRAELPEIADRYTVKTSYKRFAIA